jgi:hypothetical protein
MPVNTIIEKISEKTGLSKDDINSKIKSKLDQLSGLISEEGAAHIIANELNVKLFDTTSENLKIKDIYAGMRNIMVSGKVTNKYEVREFNSNGRQGKVGSFLIADDSGRTRITCWGSMADKINEINEGDIVKLESGFAKENNNRIEIHLNDNSKITINPEGVNVGEVKSGFTNTRKSINDINPGDESIELLATIVQSYDPNFWNVCPQCNKKVKEENGETMCAEHGVVSADQSYVMNCYLDDGTDSIRAVFFKNQIQNLLKKNHEVILNLKQTGFEEIKNDLLGKIVSVIGRVTQNEMFARKEFVAQVVNINPDPKKELENLEKKVTTTPVSEAPVSAPVVEEKQEEPTEEVTEEVLEKSEDASPSTEEKPAVKDDLSEELMSLDDLESVDDDEDIYS